MPKSVMDILADVDEAVKDLSYEDAKSFLDELDDEIEMRIDALDESGEEEEIDGSEATE
jgi:hypothetical protein